MPSLEKFKQSLVKFAVDKQVIDSINEGYEALIARSPKKNRAAYLSVPWIL